MSTSPFAQRVTAPHEGTIPIPFGANASPRAVQRSNEDSVRFEYTDDEIRFETPHGVQTFHYDLPDVRTLEQARSLCYEVERWQEVLLYGRLHDRRRLSLLDEVSYSGATLYVLHLGSLNLVTRPGTLPPSLLVHGMPEPYRIDEAFYVQVSNWLRVIQQRAIDRFAG